MGRLLGRLSEDCIRRGEPSQAVLVVSCISGEVCGDFAGDPAAERRLCADCHTRRRRPCGSGTSPSGGATIGPSCYAPTRPSGLPTAASTHRVRSYRRHRPGHPGRQPGQEGGHGSALHSSSDGARVDHHHGPHLRPTARRRGGRERSCARPPAGTALTSWFHHLMCPWRPCGTASGGARWAGGRGAQCGENCA